VLRLLLGEPSLLLLDEPTNHLDSSAKNWLMGFLSMYPGTVLLVSHEESLLRDFRCTAVAEVRDQELHVFRCVTQTLGHVTRTVNLTGIGTPCCDMTNEKLLVGRWSC
jgi:ATPase subunit of ABC transporter with duplicated ATPase domains